MKRTQLSFAFTAWIFCSIFFILTNWLTTSHIWWVYPVYSGAFWPLGVYLYQSRRIKTYSVIGSILTLGMFVFCNLYTSPGHLWFLYLLAPIFWWPAATFLGRRIRQFRVAFITFIVYSVYYIALNALYSPGHPWFIYVVYALSWYPLSTYFYGRHKKLSFAIGGTLLNAVFFTVINTVTSPSAVWAIYPIFAIIWWPLSIYYFGPKAEKKVH